MLLPPTRKTRANCWAGLRAAPCCCWTVLHRASSLPACCPRPPSSAWSWGAAVWHLYSLALGQWSCLTVAACCLCVTTGQCGCHTVPRCRYWLIGTCTVYLLYGVVLAHLAVKHWTAQRRRKRMLSQKPPAPKKPQAGASGEQGEGAGAGDALGGERTFSAEAATVVQKPRKTSCVDILVSAPALLLFITVPLPPLLAPPT